MTVAAVQTCSNWNASEAPKLLSIFLFVYCVSIHTCVIHMRNIYIMDVMLHPYTHTNTLKDIQNRNTDCIIPMESTQVF